MGIPPHSTAGESRTGSTACVGSHEPDRGDERLAIDRGLAIDLDRDAAAAPQPPVRSAEELSQGDRHQAGSEERHLADGAGAADTHNRAWFVMGSLEHP